MASRAAVRVFGGAALASSSAVVCDAPQGGTERARRGDASLEAKADAGAACEAVVLLQPPGSRIILEARDDEDKHGHSTAQQSRASPPDGALDTPAGTSLLHAAERQRRVLSLGASLAREPAVQEAVLRQLALEPYQSESQWTLPSGPNKSDDARSVDSLGLDSLPSSLDDDASPGAFFSDHWCFRSEDFYLDSLVTDDARSSPGGQDAGERAAAPLVLEDTEMAELVHSMQQELERANTELAATQSENQRLRRRLQTAGVEEDEEHQSTGKAGPRGSSPPEEDSSNNLVNAALGVAAILIMLALGRRGPAAKGMAAGIKAAASWIRSVVTAI